MSEYMYHVTSKSALQKIMSSKGIVAKRSLYNLIVKFNFKAPKAVYLSNHPLWLAVATMDGDLHRIKEHVVVLKVDVAGLDIKAEFNHPTAHYFEGNISKNRIVDIFYFGDMNLKYVLKHKKVKLI